MVILNMDSKMKSMLNRLGITPQQAGETLAKAGFGEASQLARMIETDDRSLISQLNPKAQEIINKYPNLVNQAQEYLK